MTRRRDIILVAAGIVALGAAVGLQILRDRSYPRDERQTEELLYVRSGSVLTRMALDFDALAADLYWIRAIQHYGGDRLSGPKAAAKYQLLYPLLDLTTTLDPYFKIAYRFGAIFLSEAYPGGSGRPDQAIALLRKGDRRTAAQMAVLPRHRVRVLLAPARLSSRGALVPACGGTAQFPNWLTPLAASMLSRGQDRAAARFLWQQIAQSEEAWLRRSAERALLQLEALDQIDQLRDVSARFPPPPGSHSPGSG